MRGEYGFHFLFSSYSSRTNFNFTFTFVLCLFNMHCLWSLSRCHLEFMLLYFLGTCSLSNVHIYSHFSWWIKRTFLWNITYINWHFWNLAADFRACNFVTRWSHRWSYLRPLRARHIWLVFLKACIICPIESGLFIGQICHFHLVIFSIFI